MQIDLMSADRSTLGAKPRPASDKEVSAHMRWQRERRGLPDLEGMDLEWRAYPGSRGQRLCIGATFGKIVQERREITRPRWEDGAYFPGEYQPELWENGAYSLVMPGHDAHKQTVTFESLDDEGNAEQSQTLPMEPKKGGVIWSRDDVRKAHGPVAKPDKVKRGKVETDPIPVHAEAPSADPVEFSAPAVAESEEAPIAAQEGGEALNALSGPEIAPEEAESVADLAERVAALEARLEALAVETGAGAENANNSSPEFIAPPSGEAARPKRTAAHGRAIRRAWAERKARRGAQGGMAIHAQQIKTLELQLQLAQNEQALDKQAVEEAYARAEQFARRGNQHAARRRASAQRARRMAESRAQAAHYYANWKEEARREASQGRKRADSVTRARRMITTSRKAATFQRQRADVLAAQLAKAQDDLAGAYSEAELQAAVAVERERAASLRAELEAARAEGEGQADGAGIAAAQAAAQMARAIAAEEAVAAVRADLDKERAALAAVTARNARLLQSMADLTERVERAEAAIAA